MGEPFSTIVGVGGLVMAANQILNAYNFIQAAKHMGRDHEIFDTRVGLQAVAFSRFVSVLGIANIKDPEDVPDDLNVKIDKDDRPKVWRAVAQIRMLLLEAAERNQRYAATQNIPAEDQEPADKKSKTRRFIRSIFRDRAGAGTHGIFNASPRLDVFKSQVGWAMVGRDQAFELLDNLNGLITDLQLVLPPEAQQSSKQLAEQDAAKLEGLERKLLEAVAEQAANFDTALAGILSSKLAPATAATATYDTHGNYYGQGYTQVSGQILGPSVLGYFHGPPPPPPPPAPSS